MRKMRWIHISDIHINNQYYENVSGMLLYAKTNEMVYPDRKY